MAAARGNLSPVTSMAITAGVRFSVKLAWARWAAEGVSHLTFKGREGQHTAVELERLGVLVGDLLRGVRDGVLDPAGLALGRGQEHVVGVDEDGAGRREEDVAVLLGDDDGSHVYGVVVVVCKGVGVVFVIG